MTTGERLLALAAGFTLALLAISPLIMAALESGQ